MSCENFCVPARRESIAVARLLSVFIDAFPSPGKQVRRTIFG